MTGHDEINIKVKYTPDTSGLKNIKELQSPEIKIGGKSTGKGIFDSYNAAVKELKKELAGGADPVNILKALKNIGSEAGKANTQINSMIESINKSFQSPGNQALIKDYQNLEKQLKKLDKESQTRRKKSSELSALKSQSKLSTPQARKEVSKSEELLKAGVKLTEQEQARLEIVKQILAKEEELAKLRTQEEIRSASRDVKEEMSSSKFASMITAEGNASAVNEFSNAIIKLSSEEKKLGSNINVTTQQMKQQEKIAEKGKNTVVKLGDIISGTFLGTSLSNLFQTGLNKGVQFFKEYDEILTRTMMVTTMTREEVNELTSSYNTLANQLSSTTKDVAAAQLVFYQQGLSTQEALKMTEASIAISKTGGIESAEAADRLTAAIRGYQLSANEAMDLADKMSALDAAAASSVDELTVAMQKSASQARMAGLDLDYYMAYLSTMQEVTREAPENIGTAMKSITSRLQEITDIGAVEEDGTTFSNVAKALNSIGIAAVDSSGQLRQLQDIMNELGPMWETLDRNHQAYIATTLAGNRQQSRFIALMDNYDRAMELVGISQNAAGETSKQLRDYNTGLEASFTKLTNAWQQFATRITDSSAITKLVDILTDLIEKINSLPAPLIQAITTFWALNKAVKAYSAFKMVKWGDEFKKLFGLEEAKEGEAKLEGLTDVLSKLGKGFKKTASDATNFVKTLKNSNIEMKNSTASIGENTAAMEQNTASGVSQQTQMVGNNAVKQEEATENVNLQETQETLGEAIKTTTEALKAQDDVYSGNLSNKQIELREAYNKVKSEQNKLKKQRKDLINQNRGVLTERRIRQSELRRSYEDAITPTNLLKEAKEALLKEGALKGVQLSMDPNDFGNKSEGKLIKAKMEEIEKAYKYGYNAELEKLDDEAFPQLDKNNAILENEVEPGLKEIEETLKVIEEKIEKENIKEEKRRKKKVKKDESVSGGEVTNSGDIPKEANKASKSFDGLKGKVEGVTSAVKTTVSTVKELHVVSKAFSAFAMGSMISMFANYIPGVNDQLADTIGLFAGMTKFGSDIGTSIEQIFPKLAGKAKGITAALMIVASFAIHSWNYVDKAAEAAEQELNESLDAWDKTSEAYSNMTKLVDTYDELSGKINKTAEEQEQLNSAVNELAELAPKAVIGYDLQGNAILDTSKIDEAMNEKRIKNAENANEAVLDAVKKANADAAKEADSKKYKIARAGTTAAAGLTGMAAGYKAGALIGSAGGPVGTMVGTVIGALVGGAAGYWSSKKIQEQIKRDAKAQALYNTLQEQSSTVIKGITEQSAAAIAEGAEESSQSRQELAAYITRGSFNDFTEELVARQRKKNLSDKEIKKLTNQYQADMNDAFSKLSEVGGLDKINETVSTIQSQLNEGATWSSVSGTLDNQLNSIFANAGIDDETAERLVLGIQNKVFSAMSGNIPEMQEQVQSIIDSILEGDSKADVSTLKNIKTQLANLNQGTAAALESTGLLSNLKDEKVQNLVEELLNKTDEFNLASIGLDGTLNKNGATVSMLTYLYSKLGGEMDEITGEAIKSVMNSLESTVAPTFSEIATTVEGAISNFNTLIGVINDLKESGGRLNLSTFTELFNVLDGIEEAAYSDFGNIDEYINAFDQLANGISVVNGEIVLQQGAVDALAESQRKAFIATIDQKIQEVDIAIEENKYKRQLVDAQIEALEKGLAYEGKVSEAKLIIENTLKEKLNGIEANWLTDESTKYSNYVGMINKALNTAAASFNKYYTAIAKGDFSNWEDLTQGPEEVLKTITKDFITETMSNLNDVSAEEFNKVLETQIAGLKDKKKSLDLENKSLQTKRNMLVGIKEVAESGNDALSKFASDSADSTSDYNEQLKETLTLLEKIEGLAHELSKGEGLKDLYADWNGEKEGKYLLQNLETSRQTYEVQKDLFKLYQKRTNQAAGNLLDSPYGSLFEIKENGDIGFIDENAYNRYMSLADDLQEEIDELVSAFQEERNGLRDTELALQDYAQAVKDTKEEIRDLTIEAEDLIVEAIKNREATIHEARQKALDDEISMIEEAIEARNKAREKEDQGKELYKAQEALRRATLDSSGKNNAQLLQLQEELEEKQLEIADKRFEEDMDERKQWLQDTKDAETETYEYRLETMTMFWEEAQEIMNSSTEEIMKFLIQWNEEYRQTSTTQQEKLKEQWDSTFSELKTITESLNDPINTLGKELSDVTSEIEDMGIKVEALAGKWKSAAQAKAEYASTSSGTGGGGSATSPQPETPDPETPDPETPLTPGAKYEDDDDDTTPKSAFNIDQKVKTKEKFGFVTVYQAYEKGDTGEYRLTGQKDWHLVIAGESFTIKKKFYDKESGQWYYSDGGNYFWKGLQLEKYASGGMVDYTGPAWVDGTKTHPEAFLSAHQTEQIGALANALDPSTVNNATTNSNVTFGSINFNVASMSSAADGKKALDIFVQGANDMMAKKGIGTKLNLNVK